MLDRDMTPGLRICGSLVQMKKRMEEGYGKLLIQLVRGRDLRTYISATAWKEERWTSAIGAALPALARAKNGGAVNTPGSFSCTAIVSRSVSAIVSEQVCEDGYGGQDIRGSKINIAG
jgi:hypothetical protein